MAKTIKEFREILDIIAKHSDRGENAACVFCAEHDVIYLLIQLDKVPEDSEDGKRLTELGCHPDENNEGWAYYT